MRKRANTISPASGPFTTYEGALESLVQRHSNELSHVQNGHVVVELELNLPCTCPSMYREERQAHNLPRRASIVARRGALESPVKGLSNFTGLSNAPLNTVDGPLVGEMEGDLVHIEGMEIPTEQISTHLNIPLPFIHCEFLDFRQVPVLDLSPSVRLDRE